MYFDGLLRLPHPSQDLAVLHKGRKIIFLIGKQGLKLLESFTPLTIGLKVKRSSRASFKASCFANPFSTLTLGQIFLEGLHHQSTHCGQETQQENPEQG
jgi:hypothetical protein